MAFPPRKIEETLWKLLTILSAFVIVTLLSFPPEKIDKKTTVPGGQRMSIHIEGKGLIALTTRANNRPTVTRIVVIDYHISGALTFSSFLST